MFEIGKVVMKIAGRDAGKTGVIVEVLDENFVLLDGDVRRRKCNIKHIEPLSQSVSIKKGASHDDVMKALGAEEKKKAKPKAEKKARPKAVRKAKPKVAKKEAPEKAVKKEEALKKKVAKKA